MLDKIKRIRKEKKQIIQSRLSEFKNNRDYFKELCFCILTANASAKGGIKAIDALGNLIYTGNKTRISKTLKKCGYRFWRKRADYIVETRKKIGTGLKPYMKKEPEELRDFFVKNAKGIGMKEASHFLRNIGCNEYAILDKHIINCLFEAGIIKTNEKPRNRKEYLETENKLKDYSKRIKIPLDELDLILWCSKTGEVLK